MKYVKRMRNIVDAIQWKGDNLKEIIDLVGLHPSAKKWSWEEYEEVVKKEGLKIFDRIGYMFPEVGAWIIKDSDGHVGICGSNYFDKVWEKAEEDEI